MPLCSTHSLSFPVGLNTLCLKIDNQQPQSLIFKVTSTSVASLRVTPDVGFLKQHTQLSLLINSLRKTPFHQKLQLSFAYLSTQPINFDITWKQVTQKKLLQHEIISVVKQLNLSASKIVGIHGHESLVSHVHPSLSFRKQSMMNESINDDISPGCSFHSKEIPKHYVDSQEIELMRFKLSELQKKTVAETSTSSRLRQQLGITEQKLKEITEERLHIKNNKAIGLICEEYHTSFTYLVVFALFFFVLGYLMAP